MKIHRYAHRGNIDGVQQELARGVSIESIDTNADFVNANLCFEGMTPLQCALASPIAGVDMVKWLIDRGAKLGRLDLSLAVFAGKIEKIQFLLDLGVDINEIDRCGSNALIHLLDIYAQGALWLPLDCTNENGDNIRIDLPRIYLPGSPPTALVQFLIDRGINPHAPETHALSIAAAYGWWEIVRMLLDAGCDPAVLEWQNELMQAVGWGTVSEVTAQLATADIAELEIVDAEQRTPWLLSVHLGDIPKAQCLLAAGANPLAVGYSGKLPLMYAIESRNLSMLAWLIEIGLDVNATDEFGQTALMLAVTFDLVDAVSILLAAGANPKYRASEFSDGAIDRVRSLEVLEQLLAAGADLYGTKPIAPAILSLITKVALSDEWDLDPLHYQTDKHPRFGTSNPTAMDISFWREMVKFGCWAYRARRHYQDTDYDWESRQPVWCFSRFGQSMTLLPDGRVIAIAGEHEDYYDPDFCIYNDVVVYDGQGDFQIYGYPRDVFPPTDFHTATWVDGWIYIIGNLGYQSERIVGSTPVYRLNCTTFDILQGRGYAIEPVITTGECPGWISRHHAVVQDRQIHISGGQIWTIEQDQPTLIDNRDEFVLDLTQFHWVRQVKEERDLNWQELVSLLLRASANAQDEFAPRIEFAPGLTDMEISVVESHLKFRFPPDLRAFLQTALPCGSGFPDWRNPDFTSLQEWFEFPLGGILFDVEHNAFWLDEWGTRPEMLGDALELVTDLFHSAPPLIPICNHRMMPAEPHLPGNPVFSVHQTDIIHYGFDLDDYFRHEFHLSNRQPWPTQVRPIRFWDIDRFQTVRWGDDTGVRSMF